MANQKATRATLLENVSQVVFAQGKHIVMILGVVAVLIGFFFAHRLWVAKRERSAQYSFSALVTEYDAMSREKNPEWDALLNKFEAQYAKHSDSSLLPYYQGYKVRMLLAQKDRDAALSTLDEMISAMKLSPIVGLYEVERALIQLDSNNPEVSALGLAALKELADDRLGMFRDNAQFYLGRY